MKRLFSLFLAAILVFSCCCLSFALPEQPQKDETQHQVAMIGHKGYSAYYQENTIESFQKAAEAGFSGVETDVRMTKDGVFVLSHGEEIEMADGTMMKIARHTYRELTAQPLKNEYTDTTLYLCTLAEYFDLCKENDLFCFIELKGYFPIFKIVEVFKLAKEHYDLQKCEFQSFELLVLLVAHIAFPDLRIMLATNTYNFNAKVALFLGFDLDMNHESLTADVVQRFHDKDRLVSCFTVNDKEEALRCAACGVDFMETDLFPVLPV